MSRALIFAAAMLCASPAFAETSYFAQIDDLPVAPGLEETADRTEFSSADVRIVGSSASGRAEAEHVRAYYGASLPPLGWALLVGGGGENETTYMRGREQLSLSFFQRGDELQLNVLLFSRSAPND
jgi:hypothetical protein